MAEPGTTVESLVDILKQGFENYVTFSKRTDTLGETKLDGKGGMWVCVKGGPATEALWRWIKLPSDEKEEKE